MYPFVSFDLDNTLYDYDTNAGRAVEAVLAMLDRTRGLSPARLWEVYTDHIQRIPGPRLFSDGRTSYEYRKERFAEVLGVFGVNDLDLVEECVRTYSGTLVERMAPYPEVPGVLERLSGERRVLVITDAPRDVQERILGVLGIRGFVHGLFTPTEAGNIKEDGGLYRQALKECGIAPGDLLHFGDSYFRDVQGAGRAGIRGVLVKRETGLMTRLVKVHEGGGSVSAGDAEAVEDLEGLFGFL